MFAPPSSSRKRKRGAGGGGGGGGDERSTLGAPFVVQPHISSSFDVSTKISPSVVLPRSHVPTSWLAGAPSRIFGVPLDSPDLCMPGTVVVAKIEGERQLSAIESIGDNVYALYRLSTQLRMKDIRRVASQTKHLPTVHLGPAQHDILEEDWWCGVGNAGYPFADELYASACHAALEMGTQDSQGMVDPNNPPFVSQFASSPPPPTTENDRIVHQDSQPPIAEILDQVWRQYFDTLYLAKTSLAYFSKSTLSRARATCHDVEATMSRNRFDQLDEFLRKMVLPLDRVDTKYRKSLVQSALEYDVDDSTVFGPEEESFIQRWKLLTFGERFVKESDQEFKQHLEKLKIRETELQVILLLEILALNKVHPPPSGPTDPVTPGVMGNGKCKSKSKSKSKGKNKKKSKGADKVPDLDLLLDLLVDRLCIWHSIGSDVALTEQGESPAKAKDETDHLHHFSVEVIMAFYASKLPEKCASINKKFGGGRGVSSSKPSSVVRPPKPRLPPKKKTPGLSRSNTATSAAAPGSRGTTVEPLLLLAHEGTSVPQATRGGTLSSRHFTKKIVEMNNKPVQRRIDEELKSAIQALTKPNRAAAASELVDDAEKRLTKTTTKKKVQKAGMPANNVHVAATPRKQKRALPAPSCPGLFDPSKDPVAPAEDDTAWRTSRSGVLDTPPPRRQPGGAPVVQPFNDDGGVILATPRRSLFAELQQSAVQQPKAQPRSVPIFATPQKPQKKAPVTPGFWSPCGGVLLASETPLKIPSTPVLANETSLKIPYTPVDVPSHLGRGPMEPKPWAKTAKESVDSLQENEDPRNNTYTSIYDTLGWDDNDGF